jgi:hypothetical protein
MGEGRRFLCAGTRLRIAGWNTPPLIEISSYYFTKNGAL